MEDQFKIPFSGEIKRAFIQIDHIPSEVTSLHLTNSIVNDFIPYHSLMSGKLLTTDNNKALLYSLDVKKTASLVKNYEHFFKNLMIGSYWYKLYKKNITLNYKCRLGQLVEVLDDIPISLMTIVINKEHLFNINKENPDLSKFFIVISSEFSESDRHRILYHNFQKQYLKLAKNYVDVIHTKSIPSFCYKQVPINPIRPTTIVESQTMYKDLTFKVLSSISI